MSTSIDVREDPVRDAVIQEMVVNRLRVIADSLDAEFQLQALFGGDGQGQCTSCHDRKRKHSGSSLAGWFRSRSALFVRYPLIGAGLEVMFAKPNTTTHSYTSISVDVLSSLVNSMVDVIIANVVTVIEC